MNRFTAVLNKLRLKQPEQAEIPALADAKQAAEHPPVEPQIFTSCQSHFFVDPARNVAEAMSARKTDTGWESFLLSLSKPQANGKKITKRSQHVAHANFEEALFALKNFEDFQDPQQIAGEDWVPAAQIAGRHFDHLTELDGILIGLEGQLARLIAPATPDRPGSFALSPAQEAGTAPLYKADTSLSPHNSLLPSNMDVDQNPVEDFVQYVATQMPFHTSQTAPDGSFQQDARPAFTRAWKQIKSINYKKSDPLTPAELKLWANTDLENNYGVKQYSYMAGQIAHKFQISPAHKQQILEHLITSNPNKILHSFPVVIALLSEQTDLHLSNPDHKFFWKCFFETHREDFATYDAGKLCRLGFGYFQQKGLSIAEQFVDVRFSENLAPFRYSLEFAQQFFNQAEDQGLTYRWAQEILEAGHDIKINQKIEHGRPRPAHPAFRLACSYLLMNADLTDTKTLLRLERNLIEESWDLLPSLKASDYIKLLKAADAAESQSLSTALEDLLHDKLGSGYWRQLATEAAIALPVKLHKQVFKHMPAEFMLDHAIAGLPPFVNKDTADPLLEKLASYNATTPQWFDALQNLAANKVDIAHFAAAAVTADNLELAQLIKDNKDQLQSNAEIDQFFKAAPTAKGMQKWIFSSNGDGLVHLLDLHPMQETLQTMQTACKQASVRFLDMISTKHSFLQKLAEVGYRADPDQQSNNPLEYMLGQELADEDILTNLALLARIAPASLKAPFQNGTEPNPIRALQLAEKPTLAAGLALIYLNLDGTQIPAHSPLLLTDDMDASQQQRNQRDRLLKELSQQYPPQSPAPAPSQNKKQLLRNCL